MPAVFDHGMIARIQQANDIVDVIGEHVALKRKGREMVGLCPFHDDHRPSFNVSPQKQIYKCFACSAGGDVFKFIQTRENLTFPQAVERLAERAGITLERRASGHSRRRTSAEPSDYTGAPAGDVDPNRLAKMNAWAARYFQDNLKHAEKGKSARAYLAQRGISPESAEKWRLGLALNAPDDLLKAAVAFKIPTRLLEQAGLITSAGQDKFVNRLIFTISDPSGRPIAFGGRTLEDAPAKYLNSPTTPLFDKSNCLYGLEHARHSIVSEGLAIVVEGYTDVIMAHQCACTNVVATLGTSFTAGHARMLRRYAPKLVLVFDNDVAGVEAAGRALDICLTQRLDIKLASVPRGKDPCDFLLAEGHDAFRRIIDDATDVFQFKWDRLLAGLRADDSIAARKSAVDEYLRTIAAGLAAGGLSPIEQGLRVNQVARIVGLETGAVNEEIRRLAARQQRAASYNTENQQVRSVDWGTGRFAAAQREILEILLNRPDLFDSVKDVVRPGDFDVPSLAGAARAIFETLEAGGEISGEDFLKNVLVRAESLPLGTIVTELADAGEKKANFESRLQGALETVDYHRHHKTESNTDRVKDPAQYLRRVHEKTRKHNPYNLGMT